MPQANIDSKSKKLFLDSLGNIDKDETSDFLFSLMSSPEIKDVSRHLMIAKLLKDGYTYEMITDIMGCSESTVGKIHAKAHGSPVINKLFNKG